MLYWMIFINVFTYGVLALQIRQMRLCGRRFNFRVTDVYLASILVSPALAAAVMVFDQSNRAQPAFGPLETGALVTLVGACLLGGMAIGRLDIQLPPFSAEVSARESALSVFVGGVYGLLLLVPGFCLYYGLRMAARFQECKSEQTHHDFADLVAFLRSKGFAAEISYGSRGESIYAGSRITVRPDGTRAFERGLFIRRRPNGLWFTRIGGMDVNEAFHPDELKDFVVYVFTCAEDEYGELLNQRAHKYGGHRRLYT